MSIVPSFRYDKKEDFSKWREKAKEKLAELLMLPNERCEDEFKIISKKSFDGYKRIDFEFQSEPGYFVSSSFLIPVDCTGKIPTVICIQGHSTGMHSIFPQYSRHSASLQSSGVRSSSRFLLLDINRSESIGGFGVLSRRR